MPRNHGQLDSHPGDLHQGDLQRVLKRLAESASAPAMPAVEQKLLAAVRTRRRERRRRVWAAAAMAAACFLVALVWSLRSARQPAPAVQPGYAGFVALPYAQTEVPLEQAVIVRVNVQPADLERLGLPAAMLTGKQNIQADLLIGQDGVARAVRLDR